MNAFEFNKIAGACLAALLAVFGTRTLVDELRHEGPPEKPGYVVEVASAESGASGGASAEPEVDFATIFASADAAAGEKQFKKCKNCHTKDAGGKNGTGPNLHGIFDKDIASAEGFSYSPALQGKDGNWTLDALDAFLTNPKAYVKGTKMAFAGMKKAKQRAALIKYLESLK